jgi:hypothetical protein
MLSTEDFMSIWSRINEVDYRCIETDFGDFIKGGTHAKEMAEMFAFVAEYGFKGSEDGILIHLKDVSQRIVCIFSISFADLVG